MGQALQTDSDLAMVMPRNLSANGVIMVKSMMHPEKIEKLLVEAKQAPDQESKRKSQDLGTAASHIRRILHLLSHDCSFRACS